MYLLSAVSAVSRLAPSLTRARARGLAALLVRVPGMGDSITEGSVSKITKASGAAVAVDDVVVVIETDKVAVDVRSPVAGKLTALHAKVDETVKVGAPLFTVDSDASAPVAAAPAATPSVAAAAAPAAPIVAAPSIAGSRAGGASASHVGRKPSLQFRHGKRDAIDAAMRSASGGHASGASAPAAAPAAASGASASAAGSGGISWHDGVEGDFNAFLARAYPSKATALDAFAISPRHGRPPISAAEEAFVNSGGAFGEAPPPAPTKGGGKKPKA